ncbi:alpha/beta fold hydrolase [Metabacillus litoralis]|uniref:alpha/beta fold hydrolase n=1 Tax=Metabacillus litoralis TaxID=152268 RepID=UPI00203EC67F
MGTYLNEMNWNHYYCEGSGNVLLHYVSSGNTDKTPVILLHGWPGFWFDWRFVIPELSKNFYVLAPDFRGFGLSEKPNLAPHEGYTPEHLAEDIIALIVRLKLKNAIVVAHDIGATVAQTLAKNYPNDIGGLVLLNPPYPGIGTRRFDPAVQKEYWYQHLHQLPLAETLIGSSKENIRTYISHFYSHWTAKTNEITEDDLEHILQVYCEEDHFIKSISYYRARAAAKTITSISTNTPPTLINQKTKVLWGEEDPVILAEWSDQLCHYFSDFSLSFIPEVGHFVPFEAPGHVINAIIKINDELKL